MKQALVIYHLADYDGIFSGLIAKQALLEQGYYPVLYGWNYNNPIPFIHKDTDLIVMTDISFPPAEMKKLDPNRTVWIDHHISAIENSQEGGYTEIPGIRSIDKAACELTWEYFFPSPCPILIQALGAYDVWNKEKYPWKEFTLAIQYGLRLKYGLDIESIGRDLNELLKESVLKVIKDRGYELLQYELRRYKSAVRNSSFPVLVAGRYKGLCILTSDNTSLLFDSVASDYDVFGTINIYDRDKVKISLSSEPGKLDINLGEYAKERGGGGHQSIGSWMMSIDEMIELIKNREI